MNIELIYVPKFDITIDEEFLFIVNQCAESHYDQVCSNSVQPGGFVYGWMNRLLLAEEPSVTVQASFRELDLVSKIMEMSLLSDFLTPEQMKVVQSFHDNFSAAVQQMSARPLIRCGEI